MRISDWSSDVCSSDLAVNCIARTPLSCLWGTNTDIAGVAWALRDAKLDGAIICLIGSGGAARSVLCRLYNERSEERRVGKECVSTCRSRWSPYNKKKKNMNKQIPHHPTK